MLFFQRASYSCAFTALPLHCRHQVEGNWVLYPPDNRAPEAVVHFVGGAFVGAAPQLAYRTLLEVSKRMRKGCSRHLQWEGAG